MVMFSSLAIIWTPFLFCSLVITNVKGVTIIPGALPKPYDGPSGASYASDFFRQSLPNDFLSISSTSSLLMSGRDDGYFERDDFQVLPSSSSFARGAIQAWSEHLHLALQPEQVWLTILTQLAFYLRCHSNDTTVTRVYDYRAQPQVEIQEYPDWYLVMAAFYGGVTNRCKADWVYDWLKPHFTTTTDDHVLAAHVIMLGLEQPAAVYILNKPMLCGLPSVTLDGTQADWELLLSKLDRLAEFGSEPALYGARLRPILNRFVRGFQEPDSTSTRDFWNRIVLGSNANTSCGAGAGVNALISGWITGFVFWDVNGRPYGREDTKKNSGGLQLVLDNITYAASLDVSTLPAGHGRAPFFIRNFNGTERYEAFAAAGPIGKRIDAGAPDGYLARLNATKNMTAGYDASHHSTLTPLSSWGLFGPVIRDNTTTNATAMIREQRWVGEAELGRLASSLQKNANDTQCHGKMY